MLGSKIKYTPHVASISLEKKAFRPFQRDHINSTWKLCTEPQFESVSNLLSVCLSVLICESLSQSFCLFVTICLSLTGCPSPCLSQSGILSVSDATVFVRLNLSQSVYVCLRLSLSICLSLFLSVSVCLSPFVCLCVCLSVCLSYLSESQYMCFIRSKNRCTFQL